MSGKKRKYDDDTHISSDSYENNGMWATGGLIEALATPYRPDRSPVPPVLPDAHTGLTLVLIPNWDLFRYYCVKHDIPRKNARLVLNDHTVRKHLYAKRVIVVIGDSYGSWVFDKAQQFAQLGIEYYSGERGHFQVNYVTMDECPFEHCQGHGRSSD